MSARSRVDPKGVMRILRRKFSITTWADLADAYSRETGQYCSRQTVRLKMQRAHLKESVERIMRQHAKTMEPIRRRLAHVA